MASMFDGTEVQETYPEQLSIDTVVAESSVDQDEKTISTEKVNTSVNNEDSQNQ